MPPKVKKRVVKKTPTRKGTKKVPVKKTAKPKGMIPKLSRATRIILYGPPGVGKTSLVASLPEVGFLYGDKEEGILDLMEFGQTNIIPESRLWPVGHWSQVMGSVDEIVKSGIKNLGVDSMTVIEQLCFLNHADVNFNGDWSKEGFFAYQQGPKNAAKKDWPEFLDMLDDIAQAGINVWLIGHSQVKNYQNPEGLDYDRYMPYLDKETWAITHVWAQAVLFNNFKVVIKKEGLKNKAKSDESEGRFIYTDPCPTYYAKNRMGLPPVVDCGETAEEAATNLMTAIQSCRR